MSVVAPTGVQATDPNMYGYRDFRLGEFVFSRDEYLAKVKR